MLTEGRAKAQPEAGLGTAPARLLRNDGGRLEGETARQQVKPAILWGCRPGTAGLLVFRPAAGE